MAVLSPQLLELLRDWWREGRHLGVLLPRRWLFPGRNPVEPLSTRQLNDLVGSTALSRKLDLEDLREALGAYHAAVSAEVARCAQMGHWKFTPSSQQARRWREIPSN